MYLLRRQRRKQFNLAEQVHAYKCKKFALILICSLARFFSHLHCLEKSVRSKKDASKLKKCFAKWKLVLQNLLLRTKTNPEIVDKKILQLASRKIDRFYSKWKQLYFERLQWKLMVKKAIAFHKEYHVSSFVRKWNSISFIAQLFREKRSRFQRYLLAKCVITLFSRWRSAFCSRRRLLFRQIKSLQFWSLHLQIKCFKAWKRYIADRKIHHQKYNQAFGTFRKKFVGISVSKCIKVAKKNHEEILKTARKVPVFKSERVFNLVSRIARHWNSWSRKKILFRKGTHQNLDSIHSDETRTKLFSNESISSPVLNDSIALLKKWEVARESKKILAPKKISEELLEPFRLAKKLAIEKESHSRSTVDFEAELAILEAEMIKLVERRQKHTYLRLLLAQTQQQLTMLKNLSEKDCDSLKLIKLNESKLLDSLEELNYSKEIEETSIRAISAKLVTLSTPSR